MSKSLKRVKAALEAANLPQNVKELSAGTKTAQAAADAVGVDVDQIAKSIIFANAETGEAVLFITAGGQQVCPEKASALVGADLGKADAKLIRAQTGFAIGGVSPIGHLTPPRTFFDKTLLQFDEIWAAAGTPHHVFAANPETLAKISGAEVSEFIA
ncbi:MULTISPECIES: YbaK/EbsC family protein [Halocynthiibacter]|uniref:YbaK/EbsC family protein n=1 Tax=Halocynthiibacter halioticoli TaxID=2986804 RepID=A0AAE3LUH6_9RHOB|nr:MULTISPECIES: YbaK/EbsC family protein [Halocynthiibacter]MCV6824205.1 YbaK/EbsC family protein [Halocynthiibacter halioticoli]MCW4057206.1 YbaK/EbsC family protein [Halocynthiibacter sp. SDUM655004]